MFPNYAASELESLPLGPSRAGGGASGGAFLRSSAPTNRSAIDVPERTSVREPPTISMTLFLLEIQIRWQLLDRESEGGERECD